MAVKRSADDVGVVTTRPRRDNPKRTKLSPAAEVRSNSSEPSTCSVSEASALQSTPPASIRDRISSISSLESTDHASDLDSSISSDSESDVSDSELDEEDSIVTIGGPKKPDIHRMNNTNGREDLMARVAAFLPQLQEANGLLMSEVERYSMEDVEDGEQHIEMNLGLGVLEEQRGGEDSSSDGSSADEEEDQHIEADLPVSSGAIDQQPREKETRYMDALTGRSMDTQNSGIEEVG